MPFFLSAILFLSGIFAIFAPGPLLYLSFQKGRRWAWLGALTNGLIVALAGGFGSAAAYFVVVAVLALTLAEFLRLRMKPEWAAMLTLLCMGVSGAMVIFALAQMQHLSPAAYINRELGTWVDYMAKSLSSGTTTDLEDWKESFLLELPSLLAISLLAMVWLNLMLLLRWNPGRIRERLRLDLGYFRRWKSPEFLIWPTIICGFFLLYEVPRVSEVALNLFKFLMAIYAIQGLSVLSYLFDAWKVRGFIRSIGFIIVIFLMMPLLLGLGFFDQWFDFRSKFRQS